MGHAGHSPPGPWAPGPNPLTRIVERASEQALLETAIEATASQTERLVRAWRRADRVDGDTVALERQFERWWDDDGMLVVRMRMRMGSEEGSRGAGWARRWSPDR